MPHRSFIVLAALFGFLAVAAGAFAAHGLRDSGADGRALAWIETGSRYQMWHALAMIGWAALGRTGPVPLWLFTAGIILFSGSLYALALGAPMAVAAVTPIGGVAFLAGWLACVWSVLRARS